MTADESLLEIKRRISPALLTLDGVSGVGVSQDRLRIYVAKDLATVRKQITALLQQQAAGTPYEIEVSGQFKAR